MREVGNAVNYNIPIPFRITEDNHIQFAIDSNTAWGRLKARSAAEMDPKDWKNLGGKVHTCSLSDMGQGYNAGKKDFLLYGGQRGKPGSLDGNDLFCNNARSAIMRCSTGGNRGGYIPIPREVKGASILTRKGMKYKGTNLLPNPVNAMLATLAVGSDGVTYGHRWMAKHQYLTSKLNIHPLDWTSAEAFMGLRADAEMGHVHELLHYNVQDRSGIGPMVEPFYNPIWHPYFNQRAKNTNYAPRHLCECVKPFYTSKAPAPNGCQAIRIYDGYTLAGQKCNARVIDNAEIPATYKDDHICCDKWHNFFQGLMRVKFCSQGPGRDPEVTVQARIRLLPLKGTIDVNFNPPYTALLGSCNSYVRMLSLGLRYGGIAFATELKNAAKAQLVDWTEKAKEAAEEARVTVYRNNEKEVKDKMKNRHMQWMLMKQYREERLMNRWNAIDDEWALWQVDCCKTSLVCVVMGMMMSVEYYGGKDSMCWTQFSWVSQRHEARQRFVNRYGLSRQADVWSIGDKMQSVKRNLGKTIAKAAGTLVNGVKGVIRL